MSILRKAAGVAIGSALALTALGPATALAVEANPNVALTLSVDAHEAINTAGNTAHFTFKGVASNTIDAEDADKAATHFNTKIMMTAGGRYYYLNFLPAVSQESESAFQKAFPDPGVYKYEVTESQVASTVSSDEQLSYVPLDTTKYLLSVSVRKDASGNKTYGPITAVKDDRTDPANDPAPTGKLDLTTPTASDSPITPQSSGSENNLGVAAVKPASGGNTFAFSNSYAGLKQKLTIKQVVSGTYADPDKQFSIKDVTFTLPSYVQLTHDETEDKDTYAIKINKVDANVEVNVSRTFTVPDAQLSDSETYVIEGLPVGTTYSVSQAHAPLYSTTAAFVYDNGSATQPNSVAAANNPDPNNGTKLTVAHATATPNTDETIANTTTIGEGSGNAVTFTNAISDETAIAQGTGRLQDNLPFVAMAVLPLLVIGFVAITGRRERDGQ